MLEQLGPYKLESLLGRGGMGAVYIARHEATLDQAALKLLSGHLADDANFRERFKLEIETLKRLLHPNIVQLHGYGEEQGHLYYVMELVHGRSLQDELSAGRRFDWREVVRIGLAIAHALRHAHDRGIIHRDLKPGNLLIDTQDHIKLADFGIAKLYGGAGVTAEGGVLGTADYMAPEQAAGKPVTSKSDLYSLGSVLYALLTGKPPFARRTMVEVVAAVQNDSPIPLREIAPDTPEEFETIILQLLEKDPQKRPPTALVLANRLKAMEHDLSLETQVTDPPDVNDLPLPSPQTELFNRGARPTSLLKTGHDDAEFQLSGDARTMKTGGGPLPKSSRTSLGTQLPDVLPLPLGDAGTARSVVDEGIFDSAPAAEKTTRFTPVTEDDLRGRTEADETPFKQWAVAAAFAIVGLMAIAPAIFFATRPPSADRLYASVKKAADTGDVSSMVAAESDLTRFLQLYPADSRADEMRDYAADIEQHRLQRRLESPGRRRPATEAMTPVEQAYQECVQLANTDPEAALERFDALIAVYADSDLDRATAQCLELAQQQADRLRPQVSKLIDLQRASIRLRLDRADQLAPTDRPAAEKIWHGIITLYRHKPWAHDLITLAQSRLPSDQRPDLPTALK